MGRDRGKECGKGLEGKAASKEQGVADISIGLPTSSPIKTWRLIF